MFPDLNVITFDGNSVAIYKAATFIVTQLPNETVSVLVQECPADSQSPVSKCHTPVALTVNWTKVSVLSSEFLLLFKALLEFYQLVSGGTQHHP